MSIMGIFFVLIASIAGAWLWRQGVMSSTWLEEGEITSFPGSTLSRPIAAKVGLGVFLVVAGCLFSLMSAAFFMRMDSPDWWNPIMPGVLWFNTAALIASSAAIQRGRYFATRGDHEGLKFWLVTCGVLSVGFLSGQLLAWRELVDAGVYAADNPANAFFFLLTGAHGLHVVGGMFALGRAIVGAWTVSPRVAALSSLVELCAIYWHFLLFIWLLLFAMLAGKADALGAICRRILG